MSAGTREFDMGHELQDAQADMRHGYCGGGAGMLASALVWLAAGIVALRMPAHTAIWTLLIGGVAIHPAGMLIARLLGRPGTHRRANPLAGLAGATTVWMIASLPLAYAASRLQLEWFFPAMLLVIGGRYLAFETLYGLRAYRYCGLVLLAAGLGLGWSMPPPALAALVGGTIEAGFAIAILLHDRRAARPATAAA
jgi:hypothetical protein